MKKLIKKKAVGKIAVKKAKKQSYLSESDRQWFKDYHAYTNYIGAASLYLKDNFLLERPLKEDDIKERILGHWGTVPGINFIYAHVNYLVAKHKQQTLFITGPGHGAPAVLANLFAEGTITDYYKDYPRNGKGMGQLIKDFSWPYKFPSHVTPDVPGSILEGGELGYSLATAYGAAMDNPDLLVTVVIGDGEAESGPLAASWNGNKFLNPCESGAVLPILHDNGYKISGPTIYSTMSDQELENLFDGFGYKPYFVEGDENDLHDLMAEKMELAYADILRIQSEARRKDNKKIMKVRWPMIICRTMKGWTGTEWLKGKKIEDNFRSHGIPLTEPKKDAEQFSALRHWLESYQISALVDGKGAPTKEILKYVPKGALRIGKNKNAYGGEIIKALNLPKAEKFEFKGNHGQENGRSTQIAAEWLNEVFLKNKNFRYFCPDETESNKMTKIFEGGGREYVWPVKKDDEHITRSGRVSEMLSETTLQGFLQGYILSGRHGLFATYEAFGMINASMVDQHCKFLKQSMRVPWRKPIASLNYLLTSVTWRQEHNGYSHQNPSFIANILEKHGEFASAYFPADGNSFIVTMEECFKSRNKVNAITVDKQEVPQWLSLSEARRQAMEGIMIWDGMDKEAAAKPDIVLAAAGDYMIAEIMAAGKMLREELPELKIRVVYVSEMTARGFGKYSKAVNGENVKEFAKYFTADKPVIFNFHGYTNTIKPFFFKAQQSERIYLHGYQEEGSTTTPFDMQFRNKTDRFHLLTEAIEKAVLENRELKKKFGGKAKKVHQKYSKIISKHKKFVMENGYDMPEVTGFSWK
ncbi:MAG: phosphoketolase [Candidatus Altimarinota bacterium]